jgi:hypothetical protein
VIKADQQYNRTGKTMTRYICRNYSLEKHEDGMHKALVGAFNNQSTTPERGGSGHFQNSNNYMKRTLEENKSVKYQFSTLFLFCSPSSLNLCKPMMFSYCEDIAIYL